MAVGLSVFSIRRWLEFSRQLVRYEELNQKMTELSAETSLLAELSDLLQSCLSTDEANKLITDRAQVLFPGSSGAVCVTANSRDLVEVVARWGEPSLIRALLCAEGLLGVAAGTNPCPRRGFYGPELRASRRGSSPMRHVRAHDGARRSNWPPVHGPHAAAMPLHRPLSGPRPNSGWQGPLPNTAALALANLKLRDILRSQSVRDALTGLYNRRYMEESLELELRRAMRKKCSLGIMMLDVDHFKNFNDTFGHEAGDSVLKALSNLFRTQLRGGDIPCRYGGEEFTMILPEASLEATRLRAEQLREAAKAAIAQFRGNPLDTVTLSIGVASFPEKGTTVEALLRAADSALYRAKEQGRDRVIVA